MHAYTTPVRPIAPSTIATLESERHGALMIADTSRTAQKCTTVGVPKASIARIDRAIFESAMSAITTN